MLGLGLENCTRIWFVVSIHQRKISLIDLQVAQVDVTENELHTQLNMLNIPYHWYF